MSKSVGYKRIEALLAGGAAQKQSSPSANNAAATAAPAATKQKSAGYSAIEAQLAAGAQSLGKGSGYYSDYDDYDYYDDVSSGDYERFLRETIAADRGYMPTAGEVGWNDTAEMLDTLGIQQQVPYSGGARQKTFEEQTGNKGYTGKKTAGQDWTEIRKKLGI